MADYYQKELAKAQRAVTEAENALFEAEHTTLDDAEAARVQNGDAIVSTLRIAVASARSDVRVAELDVRRWRRIEAETMAAELKARQVRARATAVWNIVAWRSASGMSFYYEPHPVIPEPRRSPRDHVPRNYRTPARKPASRKPATRTNETNAEKDPQRTAVANPLPPGGPVRELVVPEGTGAGAPLVVVTAPGHFVSPSPAAATAPAPPADARVPGQPLSSPSGTSLLIEIRRDPSPPDPPCEATATATATSRRAAGGLRAPSTRRRPAEKHDAELELKAARASLKEHHKDLLLRFTKGATEAGKGELSAERERQIREHPTFLEDLLQALGLPREEVSANWRRQGSERVEATEADVWRACAEAVHVVAGVTRVREEIEAGIRWERDRDERRKKDSKKKKDRKKETKGKGNKRPRPDAENTEPDTRPSKRSKTTKGGSGGSKANPAAGSKSGVSGVHAGDPSMIPEYIEFAHNQTVKHSRRLSELLSGPTKPRFLFSEARAEYVGANKKLLKELMGMLGLSSDDLCPCWRYRDSGVSAADAWRACAAVMGVVAARWRVREAERSPYRR
ncbi:uncharacterized protein BXZ73DRAFT_102347 [Epithele typhae]|uniref:uncharacterized protein n=1 Tax=Epithele typhae TaxID=378194 RepID=UPI0020083B01|nr:uncharacterized protein BXZ73DRAFT_102347 [Epithele typhae]KAH9928507.1 hypothetical protein BXZ73DRAFT_102347 [Epithele typhae]